jgi:aspartate kinase
MEQPIVSAVTSDMSEAKLTIADVPDRPGVAAALFRNLADKGVNVDMIVQNVSHDGTTDISFTVAKSELDTALGITEALVPTIAAGAVLVDRAVAQVSLVGAGMRTHPGVTATMFETLAKADINIQMISTSPIRISCMVDADLAEKAVRVLHEAFHLNT